MGGAEQLTDDSEGSAMPRQRAYTKTQYDEEKDKESGTFQVERSKLKRHRAVLQINNNNKKEEIKRVLAFHLWSATSSPNTTRKHAPSKGHAFLRICWLKADWLNYDRLLWHHSPFFDTDAAWKLDIHVFFTARLSNVCWTFELTCSACGLRLIIIICVFFLAQSKYGLTEKKKRSTITEEKQNPFAHTHTHTHAHEQLLRIRSRVVFHNIETGRQQWKGGGYGIFEIIACCCFLSFPSFFPLLFYTSRNIKWNEATNNILEWQ